MEYDSFIGQIKDSMDAIILLLRQVECMTTIFCDPLMPAVNKSSLILADFLASAQSIDGAITGALSMQDEYSIEKYRCLTEFSEKTDMLLRELTNEFICAIQDAGAASMSIRGERLHTAKERLRIYTADYQSSQVSFENSTQKLSAALEGLEAKGREIAGQLQKMQDGDDINKLIVSLANSVHGRKSVEQERLRLEVKLQLKASAQIEQNIKGFNDEFVESGGKHG